MPDIDPAALSRSDSISQPITTSLTNSKLAGASAPLSVKTTKSPNTAQRIDLEPLYTSLKAAIGEHWGNYKETLSLFLLGTCGSLVWAGTSNRALTRNFRQAISIRTSSLSGLITMLPSIRQLYISTTSSYLPSMEMLYATSQTRELRHGCRRTTSPWFCQNRSLAMRQSRG